jgi:hypothetical protein
VALVWIESKPAPLWSGGLLWGRKKLGHMPGKLWLSLREKRQALRIY